MRNENTLKQLTLSADTGPQVMTELKRILDSDAGRDPHLLELGEVLALSDGDHQLLVVPFPGEEIQKLDPELPNSGFVLPPSRPFLIDTQLLTEPGVPAINLERTQLWVIRLYVKDRTLLPCSAASRPRKVPGVRAALEAQLSKH